MTLPGPPVLGRSVVVRHLDDAPAWARRWPVTTVDDAVLASPAAVVAELHERWLRRRPGVVVLACHPDDLRAPERCTDEPSRLDPGFSFDRERLQFLVWTNSWDCRGGEPIWWWSRKAERLGATAGAPADVLLPDGTPVWLDGGPRQPLTPGELGGCGVVHRDAVEVGRLTVDRYREPAADLAPDQLAAVRHAVGPARVIAPAGSGKTRVLTERLRHLLVDRGWSPGSVTAVAFNTRAADELRERTPDLAAHVRTLNSLGLAICNGTGGFAPAGRRLGVVEEPEVRRLLESLLELPRAQNTDQWAAYLDGLRAIRLGLRDPAVVEAEVDAPGLADLFPRYTALLADRGVTDFDGQLDGALRRLLTDPPARATAQLVSRHLLVDEFQDLTPAHLLVLRLLAAPALDVFGVGDDDQVIYGFGGATPEFLVHFDRSFPGAAHHALEVNYRCPPAVVTAATNLLSYNRVRIPKEIRPAPGREPVPGELAVRPVAAVQEAATAIEQLRRWHDDGLDWAQLAVLARVNASLLPVQLGLAEAGIPARSALDESILRRTGVRAALAYLRIGLAPDAITSADVAETVRRPSRRIARNVVEMLTKKRRQSLDDVDRLADYLTGGDATKVEGYADDLRRVERAVRRGDTAAALRVIRVDVGLGRAMDALDASRGGPERSAHGDDLLALEQAAALHPDPATFEAWLRESLRRPGDPGGVEVSSIHRVKGREWDGVVVFAVDDGLLPHRLSDDVEEERRLLHVAITRGRRRVLVVADREHGSPFLDELDGTRPHRPVAAEGRPPVPAAPPPPVSGPVRPEVVEALKAWRAGVAAADGVPAYVVLHDVHIDDIAARAPRTLEELVRCKGVGSTRLERYGDEILAVVERAAEGDGRPGT